MDSLGSEVGQKMRCAVKAKLIELGTGGSSGYIDDELPDYVMIMVANKRSKQQMISDLNLFLGQHTEVFVIWLHEVLQKLQEVTLPTTATVKGKRKSGDNPETIATNKKDKKDRKKDKKLKKTVDKDTPDTPPTPSISDVFATHLLERTKNSQQIDTSMVKTKNEAMNLNSSPQIDDFDIPTISEITENRPVDDINREKDLLELAEIQKQIYQAKKHLKNMNTNDESEDEDFLNIKEDAEEFDDEEKKIVPTKSNQIRSPIVFDKKTDSPEDVRNSKVDQRKRINYSSVSRERGDESSLEHINNKPIESSNHNKESPKKKSVHERLGIKIQRRPTPDNYTKLTDHGDTESNTRLGIKIQRRSIPDNYTKLSDHGDTESNTRLGIKIQRRPIPDNYTKLSDHGDTESNTRPLKRQDNEYHSDKNNLRERRAESPKEETRPQKRKLDSKVFVAHPKVTSKHKVSDDDDDYDENQDSGRLLNSVIKIKPRPRISPSRQACKNLLLRAVAEAQKSTTTVYASPRLDKVNPKSIANPIKDSRPENLYSKSFRNRNDLLKRPQQQDNIIIEVNSGKYCVGSGANDESENDEYIPEPISDRGDSDNEFIYIPKIITSENSDNEDIIKSSEQYGPDNNKTQFVVTLDEKSGEKFTTRNKILREKRRLSGDKFKNSQDKREPLNNKKLNKFEELIRRRDKKQPIEKKSTANNNMDHIRIYRKPKEIQKLIIQNDTDDDEYNSIKSNPSHPPKAEKKQAVPEATQELQIGKKSILKKKVTEKEVLMSPIEKNLPSPKKRSRISVSPIKFDLNDVIMDNGTVNIDSYCENNIPLEESNKVSIRKSECVKKYDKVPELLSAVPITRVTGKTKDRCKFYPSCTNGECEFFHPSGPCKSFPNCKFADKCLYIHPKCKFDMTCTRGGCNFSHSVAVSVVTAAPPLSSHVVPVLNYKTITANPLPAMCKFYPNCSNTLCTFYHPKICRFGKNCMNKVECNFYHHDISGNNKFKWIASTG